MFVALNQQRYGKKKKMTKANYKPPYETKNKNQKKNGFAFKQASALTESSSLRDWCANVLQYTVLVTHNSFIYAKMPKLT